MVSDIEKIHKVNALSEILNEGNRVTVEALFCNNALWILCKLREYLLQQQVKVFCINIKYQSGHSGTHGVFFSTFEEAKKRALEIEETEEFLEVSVDLLFKYKEALN